MNAELITTADARWNHVLAASAHDFYHLPSYLELCARYEGGEPMAVYAEGQGTTFLMPVLLRPLPAALDAPSDWRDATTPYGYPSPLVSDVADPETLREFLGAARTVLSEAGIVSLFVRLHPLLPLPSGPLAEYGELVQHGSTVAVDLMQAEEELWSRTRPSHRQRINKLVRSGYTVLVDDWTPYQEFLEIYRGTMHRVRASDWYLFSDSYFDDLRAALGDQLHLFTVVSPEGLVAAAGLFTGVGGIVQFHLSGTAPDFVKAGPSKLMVHRVRQWAKEAGFRWLHLGGGLGAAKDSLFEFKAGFSDLWNEFSSFRMVLDAERYTVLAQRWQAAAGAPVADVGAFFPVYRAPAPGPLEPTPSAAD